MSGTVPEDRIRTDPSIRPLMEHVISATGLMYYADRGREFADHVSRRINALQLDGYSSYLSYITDGTKGKAELDQLIELLTIGETHFFRHRELFQALKNTVLPQLIAKNKEQRRLRIWSAGCSTGAEAYSIAILLRQSFWHFLSNWDVRIVGTDINREFLQRASNACFEDWALRAVSPEERKACFLYDGRRWTVKPVYRAGVSFQYHNLATPHFAPPLRHTNDFDLILCRNVMIYFSESIVRQAIENLRACLATNGWLVVGHAEHNINWFRSFRTVMSDGAVLYQKAALPMPSGAIAAPTVSTLRPGVDHPNRQPYANAENQPVDLPRPTSIPEPASPANDTGELVVSGKPEALRTIRELANSGQLQDALQRCQTFQKSHPCDPSPHFYQGLILQQSDDERGAIASLKRAIYLDRNHTLAHYYLGLVLQKQHQTADAVRCFQNAAKLLAGRPPGDAIEDAEELTVADLEQLTRSQLGALEQK